MFVSERFLSSSEVSRTDLSMFCTEWRLPNFVSFFSLAGAARFTSLLFNHLNKSIVNTMSLVRFCDAIIENDLHTLEPPNNRAVSLIRLIVSNDIAEFALGTNYSPQQKNGMKCLCMEDHGVSYHRGKKSTVDRKKNNKRHNGKHVENVRDCKKQTFAVWAGFPIWYGANRQTYTLLDDAVLNMGNLEISESILYNQEHEGYKIRVGGRKVYDLVGMDCSGRFSIMFFERTGFMQFIALSDLFATQILAQMKQASVFEFPVERLTAQYPDWTDVHRQVECLTQFFSLDRIENAREFLSQTRTATVTAQIGAFSFLILLEVCACLAPI